MDERDNQIERINHTASSSVKYCSAKLFRKKKMTQVAGALIYGKPIVRYTFAEAKEKSPSAIRGNFYKPNRQRAKCKRDYKRMGTSREK
ncbi:hypothetical protein [Nafulsella turpanensis]|uniref:hypothetical protein n=1 Tax=Nafulsella turpanensis TaxID=1265690 RepID=UPI00126922B6|nr:hypothetical protein [Nafulsella turpanensis]